uniref:R-spondin 4 n=1 Tax=Poecilia latipinna TaxID=48699 RepID=A0A3B3V5W3_9TELE
MCLLDDNRKSVEKQHISFFYYPTLTLHVSLPSFGFLLLLRTDQALKKTHPTSEDCQSCLECSRDNGCVRCPERLFLFLQRKGMSHHGTCLHSCPNGHFGQRGRDVNRCMKCRSSDCELCFSRDFCTKCKPGFKLHKGKCLIQCPEGTFAHQTDCLEWSEWSEWSVCVRDGATCGFRWGKQTRVREYSQSGKATEKASVCSPQRETQRCRMKKKCPTGKRERSHSDLCCFPSSRLLQTSQQQLANKANDKKHFY